MRTESENKNMSSDKLSPPNDLTMLVLRGILLALSFVLSAIDHSIPTPIAGVPGMSIGLANIVVLFALVFLSKKDAWFITIVKSIFVFFLRGPLALLLSMTGGILALLLEILLWELSKKKVSLLLLSALGGLMHNMGQIIAYGFYAKVEVKFLLPPLALTGLIAGSATAVVLKASYPFMLRWFKTRKTHDIEEPR